MPSSARNWHRPPRRWAVAVPGLVGDRHTVAQHRRRIVGIAHLDEQLPQPDAAVQRHHPARRRLQPAGHPQRVLQRVGQQGTQLRIADGQLARYPGVHLQLHTGALRPLREGGAQQVHRLIFAEPAGGDGLHVRLHPLDVVLSLLGLSGGQQTADHVQVVPHIVLVHRRLHLGRPHGIHLLLRLLQLHLQQGALHLRVGALLRLNVEGGQEQDIERDEHRGQKLVQRLDTGVQRVGVHRGGVIEDVIGARQAAEQQQRPPRVGHGAVGRRHEVPPEQTVDPADQQDVHDIGGHGVMGQGLHGDAAPPGRLTAQIGRAGADDGHAPRPLQHRYQDQHQRQVHDDGIDLLDAGLTQGQPAQRLHQQERQTQIQDHPLLPRRFAAAGNGHIQHQSVDQHQAVVEDVQRGGDIHIRCGHASSLSANSSFM